MTSALQPADLRFINLVATRRFGGGEPGDVDDHALSKAVGAAGGATPFTRAASLAAVLLREGVFATAPLQTALMTMHCALALEGFMVLAPQGVAAGMVRALASNGDAQTVARWLEDRAVPSAAR